MILLLNASTHGIEALHLLLEDGVALESSTDPVVLAYALRQENDIATARVVTHPLEDDFDGEDLDEAELEVLRRALEIVVEELTRPPAAMGRAVQDTASSNWNPLQKFILTSGDRGAYDTPVEIYALHACEENNDHYLVNTGGTWTPTQAQYQSAASSTGTLAAVGPNGDQLSVTWEDNSAHCDGGLEIYKGFLGIAMPKAFGGADLGISEAAVMMRTIAATGAGMSGASAVHINIFGLQPVVAFGTEEQKAGMLPPLINGERKACFAVTEPDAGLNTLKLKTQARRRGDDYVISGQKIWISTAQVADKALVLARTAEAADGAGGGQEQMSGPRDR